MFQMYITHADYFVLFMLLVGFILIFVLTRVVESAEEAVSEAVKRVAQLEAQQSSLRDCTEEEVFNCWLSLKKTRELKADSKTPLLSAPTYGTIHTCGHVGLP